MKKSVQRWGFLYLAHGLTHAPKIYIYHIHKDIFHTFSFFLLRLDRDKHSLIHIDLFQMAAPDT